MDISINESLFRSFPFGLGNRRLSPAKRNALGNKAGPQEIRKQRSYKIITSLLLGLIGFGVNFQALHFRFPPFEASLLPGLVFPIIVALAWGWPYGLLSATLGLGCQTLWFTELPPGDVESFITIPMLTLWTVWHGWCASHFQKDRFPSLNPYMAEIPFRICSSVVLYALLYGVLKWQPPDWGVNGETGVQLISMIHFKAIEQTINAYVVLLLVDVLLNLSPIRWCFGLEKHPGQIAAGYVIGTALLFSTLFWVIDGLVDYYKFSEHLRFLIFRAPESVWDSIVFNVSSPDLFARTSFVVICLTAGVLVYRLLRIQREGEAALRESERRYRRLYASMWDAFVQMDMTGRIVDCNPAFQQMLGYDADELLSMNEADLTPPQWHAASAKIFAEQILPKGRSVVYEKEYIRADQSIFTAELRTFLITNDTDHPIGIWSIVRDVTQRKTIEQEREKAICALQRSNEDLKQFAYVASHDLQEPLRMVASYTQLLAERYDNQLDEKGHKFIHYAVDGASRMQALIRDLLAFSRVETHAQEFKAVDAHSILGVAIANLKAMINETGALVTNDDLPHVKADPSQLTLVFQNLINNAIKFQDKSSLPFIHISSHRRNDCWCFSVQDKGIGIASKYKEKIFVVFKRLHTRQEYPGTGIGLALCKRIINRHGGEIWFESTLGQGTTFYFTLPS
jgi:PAS domain S-box-containing protein